MPNLQTYQQTILSASYVAATLVNNNLSLINQGNVPVNEDKINFIRMNVTALQYQMNRPDYTSSTTLTIYDRLNGLIGFDTTVNSLDPNAQIPSTVIVIVNPAGYLAPITIPWSSFSVDGSPDGGVTRITFYNSQWAGINPFLQLESPGMTGLTLGIDYILIPTGGFILSLTGNVPGIFEGQTIWAVNYALA